MNNCLKALQVMLCVFVSAYCLSSSAFSEEEQDETLLSQIRTGDAEVFAQALSEAKKLDSVPDSITEAAILRFFSLPPRDRSSRKAWALATIQSLLIGEIVPKSNPTVAANSLRPYLKNSKTVWSAAEFVGKSSKVSEILMPELMAAFKDQNGSVRYFVALAFGEAGAAAKPAVPLLIDAVSNDPDKEVREFSAKALGMIGDASSDVVRGLLAAIMKNESEGMYAEEALQNLKFDPNPYLNEWIGCADLTVVPEVIQEQIKQIGIPAIPGIVKHAQKKDLNETFQEQEMLTAMGDAAIPALEPLLKSEDPHERLLSLSALTKIKNQRSEDAEWTKPFLKDGELDVRCAAIMGYAESNAEIEAKLAVLGSKLAETTGVEQRVALGCLADLQADARPLLPQIVSLLAGDKENVIDVGVTILTIAPKSQDGISTIQEALNSPDEEIARETMWQLRAKPAVGKLFVEQLKNMQGRPSLSADFREAVGFALKAIQEDGKPDPTE